MAGLQKRGAPILGALILIVLSTLYLVEWKRSRRDYALALGRFGERVDRLERVERIDALELRSTVRALAGQLEKLGAVIARLAALGERAAEGELEEPIAPEAEAVLEPAVAEPPIEELLASLPRELRGDPKGHVRGLSLPEFLADPRWVPDGRELSPAERVEAVGILETARSEMRILSSRIQTHCASWMEDMRVTGEYVEYPQGVPPEPARGVITVGEPGIDGALRLYYFYPEEFPEIYELEGERDRTAARGLTELIALARRP